jgi:hypothetical protein
MRGVGQTRGATVPGDVVEQRFREAERALDAWLDSAREKLTNSGFVVTDHSNRSGFEKYVPPYYLWEQVIQADDRTKSGVRRQQVTLRYLDTGHDAPSLKVTWLAETFQIGSPSWFKKSGTESCTLAEVEAAGFLTLLDRAVSQAEAALERSP